MTAAPSLHEIKAEERMIGAHQSIVRLRDDVRRAAPLSAPVLIHGPTGAGKELVAQLLHKQSGRHGRLVSINVASLRLELVEAELFGVVRGAYTGAMNSRDGLIQQAAGGTLYLDEAADLPLAVQSALLRVIETGAVRPVGGAAERAVPFRLIVSVQQHPEHLAAAGRWRRDFLYRVAGIVLPVPPLRERRSDLRRLADHFLAAMERAPLEMPALQLLGRHDWPGNVRELQRVLERATFFSGSGPVHAGHVAAAINATVENRSDDARPAYQFEHRPTLADLQRSYVEQVLREARFDVRATARVLGLSTATLYRRLKSMGVELRAAKTDSRK